MSDSALRQRLIESQASRLRAWRALQGVRELLEGVSKNGMPPPAQPPCFEEEGRALRAAMLDFLRSLEFDLKDISQDVATMRKFINPKAEDVPEYPGRLLRFNAAIDRLRNMSEHFGYTREKPSPRRR